MKNDTDTRNAHYFFNLSKGCGLWQFALIPTDTMRFWRKEYSDLPGWMREAFKELLIFWLRSKGWSKVYWRCKTERRRQVWNAQESTMSAPKFVHCNSLLTQKPKCFFRNIKIWLQYSPIWYHLLANNAKPLILPVYSPKAHNPLDTLAFGLFLELALLFSP